MEYVIAKSKESYGMNNAVGYRNEQRCAGTAAWAILAILAILAVLYILGSLGNLAIRAIWTMGYVKHAIDLKFQ
jgi:hypothetical protein